MSKEIATNASLPAGVRYNKELSDFSKILYAELYLRAGKQGYCYPTNGYLARLFSVSSRTVQRALEQLKKAGAVELIFSKDQDTGREIREIHPKIKSKTFQRQKSPPNKIKTSSPARQKLRTRYD